MSARLIARRYAKAFVEIGISQGQLQQLQGELSRVTALVKENPDLGRVVENPLFAPKVKARVFDQVLRPVAELIQRGDQFERRVFGSGGKVKPASAERFGVRHYLG